MFSDYNDAHVRRLFPGRTRVNDRKTITNCRRSSSGSDAWVRDVMVGGRWLVKDRHHAGEEAAGRAYAKAMAELMAA